MCRYFCIRFIDFMLAGKISTEFKNFFSQNNFKKNDDIILNYLMNNVLKWLDAIPLSMIFKSPNMYSSRNSNISNDE